MQLPKIKAVFTEVRMTIHSFISRSGKIQCMRTVHKKLNTPKTKFLFLSMLGLLFSSTISGIVSEMGYSDSEFLSLGELLLVYLPTVFLVLVTISTLGLIKAIKEV